MHAREVSGLLGASPEPLRAGAATVLSLAIGFIVLCALRRTPIAAKQSRPDALLALMGDKSFLFSESGRSFLMFATRGRTWVALGDPVGPPAEWPGPRVEFHRAC